jgi:hypothetical protein
MKILAAVLLVALAVGAHAQSSSDGAIKATVTMLPDGRQKNSLINPETHMAEEKIQDKNGKVYSRTVYELDERNLPSVATFYDGRDKVLYKAAYTRDGVDRISEEVYTSAAGKPLGRRVYTYGGKNKVARVDDYDANGNLMVPQKQTPSRGKPDKKKR